MKYAILRWLMPIGATVLFYKAATQSDLIMGFIAFGILRSWWKDLMNLHDPKKGVILSRIGRWALLGGIAAQLLVATKPEEYVACAILFAIVWLWKLGKLPGIWNGLREMWNKVGSIELSKVQTRSRAPVDTVVIQHASEPTQIPLSETPDPRMEEYTADAEKALAAFRKRESEVRVMHDALMARLEKLEGGH